MGKKVHHLFDLKVPLYTVVVANYPCDAPTHWETYYSEDAAEEQVQKLKNRFDFVAIYKIEPAHLNFHRGYQKHRGRPRKINLGKRTTMKGEPQ